MLNLAHIEQTKIGTHGLEWKTVLQSSQTRLEAARDALLARRNDPSAMLGWMQLPQDTQALELALDLAKALLQKPFTDLVVLGIGGSSLGGIAVIEALKHPYRNLQKNGAGLRVHFVDNVDGDVITALLEVLDPQTTLVNVISKSGTTTETMSAYLMCKHWLERHLDKAWAAHVIATTDPERGVLRPMVQKYGFQSLSVPPSVGGRFSVFSAVGTLPIALAGLDVRGLIAGAAQAQQEFETQSALENSAMQLAQIAAEFATKGKPMLVLMPYSSRLRFVSDWFAQLWAESLGKVHPSGLHTGTTPIKSFGATDQHSVVQLFMEGPNDKLHIFVRLEQDERGTLIPNAEPDEPDMNYLGGKPFQTLLNAEQAATANALAAMQRPNLTISLEKLDAQNLGYLLQTLMLATAVTGELWGIDAFNQPGVELGKKFTYALMGRPGFEAVRAELEAQGVR
ncbi:MAG: glucose-6-phosphate isomerase [Deinococcales bacterium]